VREAVLFDLYGTLSIPKPGAAAAEPEGDATLYERRLAGFLRSEVGTQKPEPDIMRLACRRKLRSLAAAGDIVRLARLEELLRYAEAPE